jgi:hypothetical protein
MKNMLIFVIVLRRFIPTPITRSDCDRFVFSQFEVIRKENTPRHFWNYFEILKIELATEPQISRF